MDHIYEVETYPVFRSFIFIHLCYASIIYVCLL